MHSLTKWRSKHEDTGYILQKNAELTKVTLATLRARRAHTLFKWVEGHSGHPGNEAADVLAGIGAEKDAPDEIRLDVDGAFTISGAKLAAMTQKLAYRAIRNRKATTIEQRPRAVANINRIVEEFRTAFDIHLRDEAVWMSLTSRNISRECRQFMWMTIHDGYMVGSHWLRPKMSEELQARAECKICGGTESMHHILFECRATGREVIWGLLKQTWALTGRPWKEPSWGTALGAACVVLKSDSDARLHAAEQLWTILWTESLYLIWKLRCERVIGRDGQQLTEREVTNRWYATIDQRLTLDRRTAALAVGKRALNPSIVESVWTPILDVKEELPDGWVVKSGVLVGIKRGR
ncbi:hypothetical protein LXA43DRAFT_1124046 [Ganoderma leucocontextum]|nr:hypothetical protein LXA43DRAFT_1124046 [Ganoderma leucocontextum]